MPIPIVQICLCALCSSLLWNSQSQSISAWRPFKTSVPETYYFCFEPIKRVPVSFTVIPYGFTLQLGLHGSGINANYAFFFSSCFDVRSKFFEMILFFSQIGIKSSSVQVDSRRFHPHLFCIYFSSPPQTLPVFDLALTQLFLHLCTSETFLKGTFPPGLNHVM